ncbi:winged helix-turn-helix transcriptional regulator [Streptomyces sp. NBC_01497]|uniref:winged helix-turn-helix transcriptional regulator n=1 Tax=Streptomyces sp. NBC_01497 TaxID=2903885 RepID=UPI002E379932|nr:helix-turn-helix domain-containing protein [Streptomyces sp. NBC_01497]
MKHTSFADMQCPIARALEHAGEWWSMLILRDAFLGMTTFGEFTRSLGISENSLARRLNALVDTGLLERRPYQERPARYEYLLTDAGRDFLPVLVSLAQWGEKHDRPELPSPRVADAASGRTLRTVLVDRATGREVTGHNATLVREAGDTEEAGVEA